MRNRAVRRHHKERLLNKMIAQNYYGMASNLGMPCQITANGSVFFNSGGNEIYSKEHIRAHCKLSVDNRATCSCYMCGNPRRHWNEVTIQEKKANELMKADMRSPY